MKAMPKALLCVGIGLLGTLARAEPYLAVENGLKCSACHVNPTGGGLRTRAGAQYALTALSSFPLPEPALWNGDVTDWLRVGTDLRAASTRTRVPGEAAVTDSGLEQWRVYAAVQAVPDWLAGVLDEQLRPGKPERREAYARVGGVAHGWYAKAGQFYLPFGWRLQDSTAFVRSLSGISMATPDKGVELGLELDEVSAQVTHTRGPGNVGPVTGHQDGGQAVWLQPWGRVGLAHAATRSSLGKREATALFGGFRTGPVSWLGEFDFVSDGSFPEGRRRLAASLAEADWRVARGHNLKVTFEWLDPDRRVRHDDKARNSLVYEWSPLPYLQLRGGMRWYDGIPQSPVDNRRSSFVELHAFM